MLKLVEVNYQDAKQEYEYHIQMPEIENGFENNYHNVTYSEFCNTTIGKLIDYGKGIGLPEGYVAFGTYYLWLDDKIIGCYKIRFNLNSFLAKGPGHIGYGLLKEYRGKGYGTIGLKLAIEELKKHIREDEVYLSCYRYNQPSLKVQMNNGAFIHHYDDEYFYTRIPLTQIIKAQKEDIPSIMEIYQIGRQFMRNNGNYNQWINGYPTIDDVTNDINNGFLYKVVYRNEIIGAFALIVGEDKTYNYIEDGNWLNDWPYAVIHRIASKDKGLDIVGQAINYAFKFVDTIRIDTHKDNKPMLHVLDVLGFEKCGTIYCHDGSPRVALQRNKIVNE